MKLGSGGSEEGAHDKFIFQAESPADLDSWMYALCERIRSWGDDAYLSLHYSQGLQAHVVSAPGLQLLINKKHAMSNRAEAKPGDPQAASGLWARSAEALWSLSISSWWSPAPEPAVHRAAASHENVATSPAPAPPAPAVTSGESHSK